MQTVTIVGAGLAGCEAAWQLARRGVAVQLFKIKPHRFSPAHTSENLAELIYSAKNVQSQEQGEDVYRLSCLIIDVDVDAERHYLQDLALALGIDEQRRAALEREADAARQKLAAQG